MVTEISFVVEGQMLTSDAVIAPDGKARVDVTDDDGQFSLSIKVMRHKMTAKLTPRHVRLLFHALPSHIARPLWVSQKVTILAALRFYQTHGGALEADIQQFLASQDAQPLTADGVDKLAELISKGDELLIMSYGG